MIKYEYETGMCKQLHYNGLWSVQYEDVYKRQIYDVDGKEYVDYIDSWGPMILGHNFPEVKESVLKACEKGLSFGCATAIEVEMACLLYTSRCV